MAVTIKDVARAANTSISTVSKVINGSHSISEATRIRVMETIAALDYHPNLRARNFARQSTHTIAFIAELSKNMAFINPHIFEIMLGVQRALEQKGYAMTICDERTEQCPSQIERIITEQSADGLVIHLPVMTRQLASRITKSGIPHIVIGCPDFESQLCWIDNNNFLSGELAADHLIEQGCERIAYIGGRPGDMICSGRLRGVETALFDAGRTMDKSYVKQGDSTIENGYAFAVELLRAPICPDAIVCANNNMAFGCMRALNDNRVRVPQDVAVITFDDYPFSRITSPPLSVINIDVYEMGYQAGKLVLSKIRRPNLQMQSYTTLPTLITRESTNIK